MTKSHRKIAAKEKAVMSLEKFSTEDPAWYEKIGDIHALLERVKISEVYVGIHPSLSRRQRQNRAAVADADSFPTESAVCLDAGGNLGPP